MANASCAALLLLASPDSLDSHEYQREIALASDLGKSIIIPILRDVAKSDPRLAQWLDIQNVHGDVLEWIENCYLNAGGTS